MSAILAAINAKPVAATEAPKKTAPKNPSVKGALVDGELPQVTVDLLLNMAAPERAKQLKSFERRRKAIQDELAFLNKAVE